MSTKLLTPSPVASSCGRREPAVVAPGRNTTVRSRVRAQWLVLGAALTVLAASLVAWSLTRAAERVRVVSIVQPVAAGTTIELADLTITPIAVDGAVTGLVPAASLDVLVGRVAKVDLQPGSLLIAGMWADATELGSGERTVGAVLDAGRYPLGLGTGSAALAMAVEGEPAGVNVRIVDADATEAGELRVTIAVADADAPRIAQLAATKQLLLVGLPPVQNPPEVP